MRFRRQISITFLIAIIVPFTILVILTSLNFNTSFKEYLQYEQNIKFQSIEQIVTNIMNSPHPIEQKRELLKSYISNEQLQIQIMDNRDEVVLDMDAMPDTNPASNNIITKSNIFFLYKIYELYCNLT